eukprot:Nk52_evm27s304 gene=Nk52_evmTU27s304
MHRRRARSSKRGASGKGKGSFSHEESEAERFIAEKWGSRRATILQTFSVAEKAIISVNFVNMADSYRHEEEAVFSNFTHASVSLKKVPVGSPKGGKGGGDRNMSSRLAMLSSGAASGSGVGDKNNVEELLMLNQQDYVCKICELNRELVRAWRVEERVKALKVVIQCCKLLNDRSVIEFYPSKFVLVTEILDTFGRFVFNRIKMKMDGKNGLPLRRESLPSSNGSNRVNASALETCSNWFNKIACIRELVPRILTECALLRCYKFICSPVQISNHVNRLSSMARGVSDPLTALYIRAYLCRVAPPLLMSNNSYIFQSLKDFLRAFEMTLNSEVKQTLTRQRVDRGTYVSLFTPALSWLLVMFSKFDRDVSSKMDSFLEKYRDHCKEGAILSTILEWSSSDYVSEHAGLFLALIRESYTGVKSKGTMYYWFGKKLIENPPHGDLKAVVLEDVWRTMLKFEVFEHFLEAFEVWVEYASLFMDEKEVGIMLNGLVRHRLASVMRKDRDNYFKQLLKILSALLRSTKSLEALFSVDGFLGFWDMLEGQNAYPMACKTLLTSFSSLPVEKRRVGNPVTVTTLLRAAKALHDSVDAVSLHGDYDEATKVVCDFVRHVSFGTDFEKQLDFYAKCREAFFSLDGVTVCLIHCACDVIMKTYKYMKRQHSSKTSVFVRACIAFCFITIPSVDSFFMQLKLYLHLARISLVNHSLPQAETCFKSCIKLINDLPSLLETFGGLSKDSKNVDVDSFLKAFISELMSSLLSMPDDPQKAPLYLLNGLLNVIQSFPWKKGRDVQLYLYLDAMDLLCAYSQAQLIVEIPGVDSNDKLYAGNEVFLAEVRRMFSQLVDLILNCLSATTSDGSYSSHMRKCFVSVDFLAKLVSVIDLKDPYTLKLILNMWAYSAKALEELQNFSGEASLETVMLPKGRCDPAKYLKNIIKYVKNRSTDKYLQSSDPELASIYEKVLDAWKKL